MIPQYKLAMVYPSKKLLLTKKKQKVKMRGVRYLMIQQFLLAEKLKSSLGSMSIQMIAYSMRSEKLTLRIKEAPKHEALPSAGHLIHCSNHFMKVSPKVYMMRVPMP